MGDSWNASLAVLRLPDGLVVLQLGHKFDQPLGEVRFPPGLFKLSFGDTFNQSLDGVKWPRALKTALFGSSMDMTEVLEADWSGVPLEVLVAGGVSLVESDGGWLVDKFCL